MSTSRRNVVVSVSQGSQGIQGAQGPGGPVGGLTYATVAVLSAAVVPSDNTLAYVRGYAANEDGGQGYFRYSASSAATVDSGLVLAAAGGVGRWLRQYSGPVNVRWFGAKGDGTTDDTAAIQAALTAGAGKHVGFPAGTYIVAPTTTTWLIVASNTTLFGAGLASIIKVKNNAGNYETIISATTPSTSVSNITIRDLTFDQNATGNTTCNIGTGGTSIQDAILFFAVTNLTVERCTFSPCTGVNTVAVNGTACRNIAILHNSFQFVRGTTSAAAPDYYDNSAVYCDAQDIRLIGNHFSSTISQTARGAMEAHTGPAVISGNVTNGYQTLCNVVSQSTGTQVTSNDISVTGNTAINANYGVTLWAITGYVLRDVVVSGNTLSLTQLDWDRITYTGISLVNNASITGGYDNVIISNNTVLCQPGDTRATTSGGAAISFSSCFGIGISPQGAVRAVIVANNVIRNSPIVGIYVGRTTGSVINARISGNMIIDAGINSSITAGARAAILMLGPITNARVVQNTIYDSAAVFAGSYSVIANANLTGQNIVIRDNDVSTLSGTAYSTLVSATQTNQYYATATLDFPSIAAGASSTLTITLTGTLLTDIAFGSPRASLEAGLAALVFVSAADTISVKLTNFSASAIDPAAKIWYVGVMKPGF